MIDIHSHILPAVDDGSPNLEESVKMLDEAKKAGFDRIIATPHVRTHHYDKGLVKASMAALRPEAEKRGIELIQGYEYNVRALVDDGIEGCLRFCTEGTKTILLEMNGMVVASSWERMVFHLQQEGAEVIIAHPERYINLYKNQDLVSRMLEVGCRFQVDLVAMLGKSVFNPEKKFLKQLLKNGAVRWCASDAHSAEDYKNFAQVFQKYGNEFYCTPDEISYKELIK